MVKINYFNKNKKIASLLILSQFVFCGCQIKNNKSAINFDDLQLSRTYYRDNDYVLTNFKDAKTIESLKKDYSHLYHIFVDYSEKEIETMYESMLELSFYVNNYIIDNEHEILESSLEFIDPITGYKYYLNEENLVNAFIDIAKEEIIYNQLIEKGYKNGEKYFEDYLNVFNKTISFFSELAYSKDRLDYKNYNRYLNRDLNFKKKQVIISLIKKDLIEETFLKNNILFYKIEKLNIEKTKIRS